VGRERVREKGKDSEFLREKRVLENEGNNRFGIYIVSSLKNTVQPFLN